MVSRSDAAESRFKVFAVSPSSRIQRNAKSVLKRVFDLLVALSALVFLAPMLVVIAALIKFTDGGPALFKQSRIGHNGKEFTCLKFRSMVTDSSEVLAHLLATDSAAAAEWARDQKLRNDPRITSIGKFIRKTSLDELPQLLNILRGEM